MSTYAQFGQLGPYFSAGAINGAAKMYHYIAGTNTLKNIWSDRAMTVTLAQPFISDADGVFNFFADGLYKIVITDADDVTLYTLDNWQFIDRTDPTFGEGSSITAASTIAVGPEVFAHVTGSTSITTLTGTIPFVWLVFDSTVTLSYSASLLTPGGVDLTVQAGDALFLLNEGSAVWRVAGRMQQVLRCSDTEVTVAASDARTNTVDAPLIVRSVTTNTPAAGIGTGILVQAQSADETPCNVGQIEFVTSDVAAASEDTYFQVLLRVAGAALTACYRFVATGAFKAILTHANTADRTYTLPNASYMIDAGEVYKGPSSCGSGSTRSHEGTVTVASNGNYSGIHYYTDFTLNSGVTMTVPAGKRRLIIVASGTITINGTITAAGAGASGGVGAVGGNGTDQPGGGGGPAGAAGGDVVLGLYTIQAGGGAGSPGTAGTQITGSDSGFLLSPFHALGGAAGGGAVFTGGAGGGSIVLIAPVIVLAGTAVLNTSGSQGGGDGGGSAPGGGGGAGNVYILTRSYTDNGATFTQTGGPSGSTSGFGGGAGAAGVKQINIYT